MRSRVFGISYERPSWEKVSASGAFPIFSTTSHLRVVSIESADGSQGVRVRDKGSALRGARVLNCRGRTIKSVEEGS